MAESSAPVEMGLREFANSRGWKPSYVTQLKQAGRLVLTADKRRVLVAESLRLIKDTADPSKAGVAARHAKTRNSAPASPSPAKDAKDDEAGFDPVVYTDPLAIRRAKAQAETEEAKARKALRDEQVELGELLKRDDVLAAIGDAVTTLRTSLQNLPTTLAPELAATTEEGRCQVLLANGIEHVLEELSRKFANVGRASS